MAWTASCAILNRLRWSLRSQPVVDCLPLNCFPLSPFILHASPVLTYLALPLKKPLRNHNWRTIWRHIAAIWCQIAENWLHSAENVHLLAWHFVRVLFVFIHLVASFVENNILFFRQCHGWDFLLFFRGIMSRHDGRSLKAWILDMARPFRAGREFPFLLYLHS